jgi:hypothetical protein
LNESIVGRSCSRVLFVFDRSNTTTQSLFGRTRNPWSAEVRSEVTAGGSSGGAAAAVASYSSFACVHALFKELRFFIFLCAVLFICLDHSAPFSLVFLCL